MGGKDSLVHAALDMLPPRDRRKYRIATLLQMATSLMDLAGILLFGVVGVLAATATQGNPQVPQMLQKVLDAFGLQDVPTMRVALGLAAVAAGLLVAKGLLTLLINRRVGRFLARCAYQVSKQLSERFFSMPLFRVQQFPGAYCGYALSSGVNSLLVDVLSNGMIINAELALLAVLGVALLLVDPLTTVIVVVYFVIVMLFLTRGLRSWARRSGEIATEAEVGGIKAVLDGIATYREITVAGNRDYITRSFQDMRRAGTQSLADQRFIGMIPRYVMEMAMVVGAGILVVTITLTQTTQEAIGSLALFLAASSRVMPSLLRLNNARLSMHTLRGRVDRTLQVAALCDEHQAEVAQRAPVAPVGNDVVPVMPDRHQLSVEVSDVKVRYPGSPDSALKGVSFSAAPGARVALVGPSGAGKSTLSDALLGVVEIGSGQVRVGGMPVPQLIEAMPGAVSYVPQDVALVDGTVRENVALGVDAEDIDDERVAAVLARAHLLEYLEQQREGLYTLVGERGTRLSGGQRQRLGIARALYPDPGLIVLDEATSALDAETEHIVTSMLAEVGDGVTTVTVAHRLATIRQADLVLYMEDGRVLAQGTFEQVRDSIPQFDRQATLLGL